MSYSSEHLLHTIRTSSRQVVFSLPSKRTNQPPAHSNFKIFIFLAGHQRVPSRTSRGSRAFCKLGKRKPCQDWGSTTFVAWLENWKFRGNIEPRAARRWNPQSGWKTLPFWSLLCRHIHQVGRLLPERGGSPDVTLRSRAGQSQKKRI